MKMLNTTEVAAQTGISAETLVSWRSKKIMSDLKFYKIGRRILYSEPEVEAWLETKQTTTAGEKMNTFSSP